MAVGVVAVLWGKMSLLWGKVGGGVGGSGSEQGLCEIGGGMRQEERGEREVGTVRGQDWRTSRESSRPLTPERVKGSHHCRSGGEAEGVFALGRVVVVQVQGVEGIGFRGFGRDQGWFGLSTGTILVVGMFLHVKGPVVIKWEE